MRILRFEHDGTERTGTERTGALAGAGADEVADLGDTDPIRLRAPLPRPPKFLAIGLNYADHIAEAGMTAPEFPVFFNKQTTCVVGPGDAVHVPRVSALVDYEGDLGVVIGRRCRHVPAARAHEVTAGYTVVNDVTVRDWQFKAPTMTIGKSFDTHGPIGPWVVTADEIPNPQDLRIRTWVNDDLRQDASTKGGSTSSVSDNGHRHARRRRHRAPAARHARARRHRADRDRRHRHAREPGDRRARRHPAHRSTGLIAGR